MTKPPQKTHETAVAGEKTWVRQTWSLSISCYEQDVELLNWLTEYLGCSKSEAVRTAVRLAAAQFAALPRAGTSPP